MGPGASIAIHMILKEENATIFMPDQSYEITKCSEAKIYAPVKRLLLTSYSNIIATYNTRCNSRDYVRFIHRKNTRIKISERLTHLVAGCVTFCFDGCCVCCLRHGP